MKNALQIVFIVLSNSLLGQTIKKIELPYKLSDTIAIHTGYSVSYNQKFRQANWVGYCLTRNETNSIYKRENRFVSDPLIKVSARPNTSFLKIKYS